jgi:hypothetical protein
MKEGLKLSGTLEVYEIDINTHGKRTTESFKERLQKAKLVMRQKNTITNVGFSMVADRLTGQNTYASTTLAYFSVSNGNNATAITDTAAGFLADGTTFTKSVESVEAFNVISLLEQWNCFLSSSDNTVTTIKKFALMNALVPTAMFNNVKFAAISKDSSKELYLRYKLTMTQV